MKGEARDNDFPIDDATLHMLAAACEINPDTGRTHLMDFLDMGARVKSMTEEAENVYLVEHEEGYEPFSPHHVIRTLVAEILRLRYPEARWQPANEEDSLRARLGKAHNDREQAMVEARIAENRADSLRTQLEQLEGAVREILQATYYDNAVGQLKKIKRIARAATTENPEEQDA